MGKVIKFHLLNYNYAYINLLQCKVKEQNGFANVKELKSS